MKKYQRRITLVSTLVILAVVGITVVAIADSELPWESSGESNVLPSSFTHEYIAEDTPDEGNGLIITPAAPASNTPNSADGYIMNENSNSISTGLQSDDNGFTGPFPEISNIDIPMSANMDIPTLPNWNTFMTGTEPDNISPGKVVDESGINWSSLYYYVHVAGSAFRPRNSSVDWGNDGSGGCLYLTEGNTNVIFNIHLDIPNGSRIEYLRIYYYDASETNSYAFVTRYNDEGALSDVTYVTSDGNAGYGTKLGAYLEHVVDTTDYSYVLNWRPYVTGNTMQLCGLRVAYRLPD